MITTLLVALVAATGISLLVVRPESRAFAAVGGLVSRRWPGAVRRYANVRAGAEVAVPPSQVAWRRCSPESFEDLFDVAVGGATTVESLDLGRGSSAPVLLQLLLVEVDDGRPRAFRCRVVCAPAGGPPRSFLLDLPGPAWARAKPVHGGRARTALTEVARSMPMDGFTMTGERRIGRWAPPAAGESRGPRRSR
jgi:hypothetical protein